MSMQYLKLIGYSTYTNEEKTIAAEHEFKFASYQFEHITDANKFTMANGDRIRIIKRANVATLNCTAIVTGAEYNVLLDISACKNVECLYQLGGGAKKMTVSIENVATQKARVDNLTQRDNEQLQIVFDTNDLYVISFTLEECKR